MSPMINSVNITEACARALVVLASSPCDLTDFDARVPRTLAKNGLAEIDEAKGSVNISAHGLATLKAINAKGGETDSTPQSAQRGKKARKAKGRPRSNAPNSTARFSTSDEAKKRAPTKRESPPPTGVVDFDALRAQIVARYEADLAACDRMREIAETIGA